MKERLFTPSLDVFDKRALADAALEPGSKSHARRHATASIRASSRPGVLHMLEVLDKGACSNTHRSPLLFIHGAWHAAWCWDENFLGFFADHGYRAMAVSLRGHGNSPSPKSLRFVSAADYVADVEAVVSSLPNRPILIGHSLGGYVVQKYLESHDAPAGVLAASMPARGAFGFTKRLIRREPWLVTKLFVTGNSLDCFNTPDRARKYFFSARTPDDEVARHVARLSQESQRVALDALALSLPRPKRVGTPLLVLGAEFDSCITVPEVQATARAYHTTAEIFPGMGHDVMLEPDWRSVAERIDEWLTSRAL